MLQAAINGISFTFPPISILTQTDQYSDALFCDTDHIPDHCLSLPTAHCLCTHRLKVKLNSIVELVIVDETSNIGLINHPFHLHGYALTVSKNTLFINEIIDDLIYLNMIIYHTKRLLVWVKYQPQI